MQKKKYRGSEPNPLSKMDAIKKKMQAMKLEKDNAMDRADACEQQAKDANLRAERVINKFILCDFSNAEVVLESIHFRNDFKIPICTRVKSR